MYGTHKTVSGAVMNIAQMDNNHLINTISLILKRITLAKENLRGNEIDDPFKKALLKNQIKSFTKPQLTSIIQKDTEALCPYIAEAALRGLSVSEMLQLTFERKEAIPKETQESFLLIAAKSDVYEEEDDDDDIWNEFANE